MERREARVIIPFYVFREIGCLPCAIVSGIMGTPCDIHHAADKKRDEKRKYGNCPWHHRGMPPFGHDDETAKRVMGPNLRDHHKEYRDRFGTEQQLVDLMYALAQAQWSNRQSILDDYRDSL